MSASSLPGPTGGLPLVQCISLSRPRKEKHKDLPDSIYGQQIFQFDGSPVYSGAMGGCHLVIEVPKRVTTDQKVNAIFHLNVANRDCQTVSGLSDSNHYYLVLTEKTLRECGVMPKGSNREQVEQVQDLIASGRTALTLDRGRTYERIYYLPTGAFANDWINISCDSSGNLTIEDDSGGMVELALDIPQSEEVKECLEFVKAHISSAHYTILEQARSTVDLGKAAQHVAETEDFTDDAKAYTVIYHVGELAVGNGRTQANSLWDVKRKIQVALKNPEKLKTPPPPESDQGKKCSIQ